MTATVAEAQLQQFLEKVRQLNAFVALSEEDPALRQALTACDTHHQVVELARRSGFEIGRRWGEAASAAGGEANLLTGECPPPGSERTTTLMHGPGWRLETIHSCLASTPEGQWLEEAQSEWVMLLQGSARLQFEDESAPRDLCRGDSVLIIPHRRHRVVSTDGAPGSVWLALFFAEAFES